MTIDKDRLLLSAQRALLGSITPGTLAVWVDAKGSEIRFWAFAESGLSDDERDEIEAAGAELSADFPGATSVDIRALENVKQPLRQPDSGWWVFARHGCAIGLTARQEQMLRSKGAF